MENSANGLMRNLAAQDMAELEALVEAANWNQTRLDWLRLLRLCGAWAKGIEVEGKIISSATLLPFGEEAAWLGMVLTMPEHRRHGHAKRLLTTLLEQAPTTMSIYLDATSQGKPLYQSMGFREEGVVARWSGPGGEGPTLEGTGTWNAVLAREANGMDRTNLLRALGEEGETWQAADGSFAMLRKGRLQTYLGPVVAKDADQAREMVQRAIQGRGRVFCDILEENRHAVELFAKLGFQPVRTLLRMRRGRSLDKKSELQFAIAGFEYG